MKITVNVPFFKVIVLKVEMLETLLVDERHFADRDSADKFIKSLEKGLIGVVVEV